MKFFQLRAIVAVADCGNFSEAALELQLSQLAISHAIATLEEKLGVPLFTKGLSIGFASFHTLWTHSSQPLEDFSNPNKYC